MPRGKYFKRILKEVERITKTGISEGNGNGHGPTHNFGLVFCRSPRPLFLSKNVGAGLRLTRSLRTWLKFWNFRKTYYNNLLIKVYDSQEIDKGSGMLHGHSGALVSDYVITASEPSTSKAVAQPSQQGTDSFHVISCFRLVPRDNATILRLRGGL
jgi:hypothetical protein